MGILSGQLSNVVEWEETSDDIIFYKWNNAEIKKGSVLIIRPGQDAIFMYNGKIEGIFKDEGRYDIESKIIPFLSTLKGFRFGFKTGLKAEVLFVNTKEFTMRWGTKQAINLPSQALPGGLPIRANGTFNFKVGDYQLLIEKIAGVKKTYSTADVRERVLAVLDQLLLRWIVREGKDMFNIQANAVEISKGIQDELDMELVKIGLTMTGFQIMSVTYPEEIQAMINKAASQSMVGDMNKYTQMAFADALANGGSGGNMAVDMASASMGMMMGQQMMQQMQGAAQGMTNPQAAGQAVPNPAAGAAGQAFQGTGAQAAGSGQAAGPAGADEPAKVVPNFCPNCGAKTNGANFCGNCGTKLV
jgi:membrane protease subunit (stomatin/prohibitin family)